MAGSKVANEISPRRATRATKSGREALLLAAERLFAEHGVENVSMRQIVSAAGQANHYAVQHHFGGENGLIRAILELRLPEVNAIRARMLRSRGGVSNLDTRALVRALLLPLAQFVDDGGRHTHARFMLRLQERDPSSSVVLEFAAQAPTAAALVEALRERLTETPAPVFALRLRLASHMFLYAVATLDTPAGLSGMSQSACLTHAVEACVAILTGPAEPVQRGPA